MLALAVWQGHMYCMKESGGTKSGFLKRTEVVILMVIEETRHELLGFGAFETVSRQHWETSCT